MTNGIRPNLSLSKLVGRLALIVSVVISILFVTTITASAATPPRIDLKFLVITDGGVTTEAIAKELTTEGVPFTKVDLNSASRPTINATFLGNSTNTRAYYQAVVVPNETALPAAERAALSEFEVRYGVREMISYTWANPSVGLNYAANPGYIGTLDAKVANLSVSVIAANAPFSYLKGAVAFEDSDPANSETFGYLATPQTLADGTTPYSPVLTMTIPGTTTAGSLLGVLNSGGHETIVSTFNYNFDHFQFRLLAHGIVTWLSKGVHLGMNRNYFAVHVDDVLNTDTQWNAAQNCTPGSGCPDNPAYATSEIRMQPSDVAFLNSWQTSRGIKLDMAYNFAPSQQIAAASPNGTDSLRQAFTQSASSYRWLSHTYTHQYLGCVQDTSVAPWQCAKTSTGATQWLPSAQIRTEIVNNLGPAQQVGISAPSNVLVSGEHSGLKSLPQMTTDNPNFVSVLGNRGIAYTASDASREPDQRTLSNGVTRTVPRYPMNIYYNVASYTDEVDEYNWIYTSAANGGSGICTANPATSTCIAPLAVSKASFDNYILPKEVAIDVRHALSNNPRPHYAHQTNLTQDRILYPVLDAIINRVNTYFAANTPLVNASMADLGLEMRRQAEWAAAVSAGRASGYRQGNAVVVQTSSSTLQIPLTAPTGSKTVSFTGANFGSAYQGERSAWTRPTAVVIP